MRVFVQIPCLNEEATLPLVLESIPKKIPGVELEVMIVDDGSSDKTIAVAQKYGVKHIVRHTRNMGLSRSFRDGVLYALEHGADIVVNTDGDNQYPQKRIPDLIQPILDGTAEIVIADRQTQQIAHFSPLKKLLQRFGSHIVNRAAGTELPDAASGFRAYSREALIRLNIITQFSYCMETIIQAGNKRLAITSIPIKTNPKTRESRLFKNMWQHIYKSSAAIIRSYIMYRPYVIFGILGWTLFVIGMVPFIRWVLYATVRHSSSGHLQSLIVGSVLLITAFLCLVLSVIADLVRTNRILLEENIEQTRRHNLARTGKKGDA